MKKIISIFAAVALALGVAGCSNDGSSLFYNDLHDAVVSPLYIEGDIASPRTALTMLSNTEQEFKFTYKNDMSAWGGGKGVANFKIVRDSSGWLKDWGAEKDTTVNLVVNADYTNLAARDATNDNPGNIVIKDLAENQEYVLKVNYNAVAGTVALKCEGKVVSYPELKVVFVSDDGKGGFKEETIPMTRTDKTFKYVFTPKEEDTLYFYISDGNYLYWDKDGKILTEKLDLEKNSDKLSEVTIEKNNEGVIPAYSISVDVAALPEISISAGVDDTSILGRADIIGAMFGWTASKLTRIDESTYEVEFTANESSYEYDIREKAGSWSVGRWFTGSAGDAEHPATDKMAEPAVAGKDKNSAEEFELVYYKGDPGMSGTNAKITGLPYKTGYVFVMQFKIKDASKKEITVKVYPKDGQTIAPSDWEKPSVINLEGYGARGLNGKWGDDDLAPSVIGFTKQSNGDYTLDFIASGAESAFKIANVSWTAYPLDDQGNCQNIAADGTSVKFYKGDSGMNNPNLTGMENGKSYRMTVTPSEDYITVKVSKIN